MRNDRTTQHEFAVDVRAKRQTEDGTVDLEHHFVTRGRSAREVHRRIAVRADELGCVDTTIRVTKRGD